MDKIVLLDEVTANQIAAGEVIERPASVVKELAENAIDAKATQITIEIQNGGISFIRVTDNGVGIDGEDLQFAFERHATSKIRNIKDLDTLSTMGFRGEALASIASVSNVEVISKTSDAETGTKIEMEGGHTLSITKAGAPEGTSFVVRNLFYNTPARYKFLKKDTTESGYISEIIVRIALANPGISFKYIQNKKLQLHTPGNHDLLSTIYSIFGKDTAKSVLPVKYENNGYTIAGFIGKPEIARGNRNNQYIFLNGRYIKSPVISKALEEAYKTILMQKKFPFSILILNTSPENYDVNVHPQKLEVRFANDSSLYSAIYHAVKNSLLGGLEIRGFERPNDNTFTTKEQPLQSKYINNQSLGHNMSVSFDDIPPCAKQTSFNDLNKDNKIAEDRAKTIEFPDKILEHKPNSYETVKTNYVHNYEPENENKLLVQDSKQTGVGAFDELLDAQIVGQAFDTYIMLQKNDSLYIIDQHAAHERIRYETMKDRLSKKESFSQIVLEPYIIQLKAIEFEFVAEKIEDFTALGFDFEPFGTNTIILRSIPDFYDSSFSIGDFIEILDRWMQIGSDKNGISDETVFLISCKGALKANKTLSKEEIRGLVKNLNEMENPFTCIHGRPVILVTEKKEFEKKFKRIV